MGHRNILSYLHLRSYLSIRVWIPRNLFMSIAVKSDLRCPELSYTFLAWLHSSNSIDILSWITITYIAPEINELLMP
jgi:hypothetical protein